MKLSRVARVVLGGLVVLVGLGVRSLEAEYGSGLNFSVESDGTVHRVFEVNEQAPETKDRSTPVFEGTEEEVSAYIARRRAEGTNLMIPNLIIGVGALIVIAALIPSPKTPPNGPEATPLEEDI